MEGGEEDWRRQMVRQAKRYLAGAASSAALIAVAIVAFVLLVSAEAFRQWPIGGLGSGDPPSLAPARSVEAAAAAKTRAVAAARAARGRNRHESARRGARAGAGVRGERTQAGNVVADLPGAQAGSTDSVGSGGGETKPSPAEHSGGSGQARPTAGGGNSNGGGSGGGGAGDGGGPRQSVSAPITEAVKETVSQVDATTGGTLEQAGVTPMAEEAVEAVAGTESTIGQTVDKSVQTAAGVLEAGR
jgi:hypothetical protein